MMGLPVNRVLFQVYSTRSAVCSLVSLALFLRLSSALDCP